ncbi:BICD family-like cargo adapter 1 [Protopterus annectens]|uniref:BICD family-like cargo adapter 1 n=1 Tax=Protopterus annectens TaxID=7888 RepID=UPI001CFA36A8|nr:BICD family-like cargo adapter 1 [Protopterus annectens]
MSDSEILDMKNRMGTLEDDFYTIHLADDELSPCRDLDSPELISTLRQKDKQLTLAAQLGKALLEENQALKEEKDRLQEGFMERIEELQQENHELRLKYEAQEVAWDDRVYELEKDAQELQEEVTKMRGKLREADKDKTKTVQDLAEKNQRLSEQLNKRPCGIRGNLFKNISSRKIGEQFSEVFCSRKQVLRRSNI